MTDEGERLTKRVAALVPCSRREAEPSIAGGWVRVDGQVVEEPQFRVLGQRVELDPDASLLGTTPATLLLHKPPGHDDGTPAPDAPRQAGAAPAARALLQASGQWAEDSSGLRLLKRHGVDLASLVPLAWGASGLLVFSQDWRVVRKLREDAGLIEHELMVDVTGEVSPEVLRRLNRPPARGSTHISLNSDSDGTSRLRCAVKGGQPGLLADLCQQAGLHITGMKRIRIGRVMLAGLPPGQWRFLLPLERF